MKKVNEMGCTVGRGQRCFMLPALAQVLGELPATDVMYMYSCEW